MTVIVVHLVQVDVLGLVALIVQELVEGHVVVVVEPPVQVLVRVPTVREIVVVDVLLHVQQHVPLLVEMTVRMTVLVDVETLVHQVVPLLVELPVQELVHLRHVRMDVVLLVM